MARSYYGNKISDNMTMTPEGYLLCANVPIGRTGWMEYLGQELPSDFNEPAGNLCRVYRSTEELFNEATMASFEGKSITNTHPTSNLDIDTTPATERGHAQNVRRDGDFLVADLFIKDAGLIHEVQNNLKREVSCGYDCSWSKIGDGKYEQKDIVGNHVAVVPNGRAGSKVAIRDSKPEQKQINGGNKFMGKISKSLLTAIGFKQFVQDAEPEDIRKAMDALNQEEKEIKDAEPEKKEEPAKDAEPDNQAKEDSEFKKLADQIVELKKQIAEIKSPSKKEADDAQSVLDAVEEDLGKEAKDEDPEKKEEEPVKDEEPTEKSKVADAALKKFVQDMKPIIMAIPDEKLRVETARKFASTVKDARPAHNGYGDILNIVASNKKAAMDKASIQKLTMTEAAAKSCDAWKVAGENMKNKGAK